MNRSNIALCCSVLLNIALACLIWNIHTREALSTEGGQQLERKALVENRPRAGADIFDNMRPSSSHATAEWPDYTDFAAWKEKLRSMGLSLDMVQDALVPRINSLYSLRLKERYNAVVAPAWSTLDTGSFDKSQMALFQREVLERDAVMRSLFDSDPSMAGSNRVGGEFRAEIEDNENSSVLRRITGELTMQEKKQIFMELNKMELGREELVTELVRIVGPNKAVQLIIDGS